MPHVDKPQAATAQVLLLEKRFLQGVFFTTYRPSEECAYLNEIERYPDEWEQLKMQKRFSANVLQQLKLTGNAISWQVLQCCLYL